mgnify:CR=1 FL=1
MRRNNTACVCISDKHRLQKQQQYQPRDTENADDERIKKIQPQRKAGQRRGETEQKQRQKPQKRIKDQFKREFQRCGEQPHDPQQQKRAEKKDGEFAS